MIDTVLVAGFQRTAAAEGERQTLADIGLGDAGATAP